MHAPSPDRLKSRATGIKVKQTNGITKFKVRCSRFLYTFRVADAKKAEKLLASFANGTARRARGLPRASGRSRSSGTPTLGTSPGAGPPVTKLDEKASDKAKKAKK